MNYKAHRRDRKAGGGGVMIAVRDDISFTPLSQYDTNCELTWIELQLQGAKKLIVGAYYRPPKSTIQSLEELDKAICNVKKDYPNAIIMLGGDFNLGDISWDELAHIAGKAEKQHSDALLDIVGQHNLEQLVREPTRKNRMLDLFLTNTPDLVDKCKVGPGVSDHDGMVLVESRLYHKWSCKSPRKINLFRNANWEKIKADLKCEEENFFKNSPAENTVETNWSFFKQSISDAISNHVSTKTVSGRYKLPWITVHIKRLIRRKQRAFCKAKKSGTEGHWQKYRALRKAVQTQTRKAHWDYLNGLLDPAEDRQSKNLWRYLKSQRQEASDVGTLNVEGKVADTPAYKAEALNVQFSSVFTHEDHRNRPVFKNSPFPSMPEITVTTAGVKKNC